MNELISSSELILNWISLIGTPISFMLAYFTWRNTRKIKSEVSKSLDKADLQEDLNRYEVKCKELIIYLNSIPLIYSSNKIMDIRNLLIEINQKYPYIDKKILKSNRKIIALLSKKDIRSKLLDNKNTIIDGLSLIKNTLYKETRL